MVLIPQHMSKAEEQVLVADMVRKVLAREMRTAAPRDDRALSDHAKALSRTHLGPLLGTPPEPAGVTWVTNQQQRWGSCTPSSRQIRLSHRLRSMPSWVVDYVIVHELAHLVEPNHSAAFWRLARSFPDADRAEGYLAGYLAGQQQGDTGARENEGPGENEGAGGKDRAGGNDGSGLEHDIDG